jgi:hypothetical protein
MRRTKLKFDKFVWVHFLGLTAVAILLTLCVAPRLMGQQRSQKTFASAEEASKALMAAAQSNDEKVLLEILGPDGKQIVSSGDDAEDAQSRANFVQKYQEMHRLVREPDGSMVLYIGAENWPTPIPLVKKGGAWYFDTEAGKEEILFRRIGENEISAIGVCDELVAAEKEYRSAQHNEYAQRMFSEEGHHNGLYWTATENEPQSPIGPLLASAVVDDDGRSQGRAPTPFRGYYFRILTRQGKDSPGGPKSYIIAGKMSEGFAFVAYPAEYGSSGVMTFIVSEDGDVYEKDLGERTEYFAKSMKEYNPNGTWQKADEQQEESASADKNN